MAATGEERIYKFCLGIFIIFFGLNHIYPGTQFLSSLMFLAALFAVILILKGIYEFIFKNDEQSFNAGVMVAFLLIVLFGGLQYIMIALKLCLNVIFSILAIVLGALTAAL